MFYPRRNRSPFDSRLHTSRIESERDGEENNPTIAGNRNPVVQFVTGILLRYVIRHETEGMWQEADVAYPGVYLEAWSLARDSYWLPLESEYLTDG
jgi:hypothetical protein